MVAGKGKLEQGKRPTLGTPQREAPLVGRHHLPDDGEAVAVTTAPGEAGDHIGWGATASIWPRGAARIGDDDPHATLMRSCVHGDLRPAVFDCVDDQVVERLGELNPVAENDRATSAPAQAQRTATDARSCPPATHRRVQQWPRTEATAHSA